MATDLGDLYPITVETRAAPVPPATEGELVTTAAVDVVVTLPDGTAAPGSPFSMSENPTGTWQYDYATTVPGLHAYEATSTGAIEGVFSDTFVVVAPLGSIVSLQEAREYLDFEETDADELLRATCIVASQACEEWTGKTWMRQVVTDEPHGGCGSRLRLRRRPVLSVTSVEENGVAVPGAGYFLNARQGWLYRGTTQGVYDWTSGVENITVTYIAGPPGGVVPETIRRGVLEMVRHLWTTQRGASGFPSQGTDSEWSPGAGYSIPRWVEQLWAAHRAIGVA